MLYQCSSENIIDQIKQYIKKAIEANPIKEEGKTYEKGVFYCNGNDGTQFDWECNGRTCEFFVWYDTKDALGYIQVFVTNKGTIEGYIYDTERRGDGKRLEPEVLNCYDPEEAAFRFMKYLLYKFDYEYRDDEEAFSL